MDAHTDMVVLDMSIKVMAGVTTIEDLQRFGRTLASENLKEHDKRILRAVYAAKLDWLKEQK